MEKKLPLTAAMATVLAGLAGCSDNKEPKLTQNTRVCVDKDGSRIGDQYCGPRNRTPGASFFYLRAGAPIPMYYDNVRDPRFASYGSSRPFAGGFAAAPASANMARPTGMASSDAVSRGGLGRSARVFGARGG